MELGSLQPGLSIMDYYLSKTHDSVYAQRRPLRNTHL